jgi:hypothetical protein
LAQVPDTLKTVKIVGFGTTAVVLLVMQVVIFSVVTDFVTSLMLCGVSFVAGRLSKH